MQPPRAPVLPLLRVIFIFNDIFLFVLLSQEQAIGCMGQERCAHTLVFPALCFVMRLTRAHTLLARFRLVISI